MKQRITLTKGNLYYPQYKWAFWWLHYKTPVVMGWRGTMWCNEGGDRVVFGSEDEAKQYLDDKYKYQQSISMKPRAWIQWNPPQ